MNKHEPWSSGLWVPVDDGEEFPVALQHKGAFVPRPLPSDVTLRSKTHKAAALAERTLGRLNEAAERLPDRSILVRTTQLRDVQRSAGLDHVPASLREMLLLDLLGPQDMPSVAPALAAYLNAVDVAFAHVHNGGSIDLDLFGRISMGLALHQPVDLDASWRSGSAWLGGREPRDASLICVPPGPHLRAATEQWFAWVHANSDLPLVCKIALGHYQIEMLQPFAFGTHHLSRLYIGLELVRAGALRDQILPISVWLDRHRADYHAAMQQVANTGTFDDCVELFAEGIRAQSIDQMQLIAKLERLREEQLARISGRKSGPNKTREVLSDLISFPVTNHKHIARRLQVSFRAATAATRTLHSEGIVEVLDNKRYRKVFICTEVMKLLNHDPMPPEVDSEVFDNPFC